MVFAIHWRESAMGVMCAPILSPPPTSLPTLWVVPEHELWVPCFMDRTCTGHLVLHMVSMLFPQIIPPSPSPSSSKNLFFTSVSLFAVLHLGSSLPSFYVPFIYALIYCIGVSLREPFLNDSTAVHDLLLLFYALASDIRKFQIIPQFTFLTLNASEMFSLLTLLGEAKTFTRSACARASSLCSQSGQTCSVLDIFSPTEEDRSPKHFRLCAAAVLTFGLCVLQGCEAWRCESFLKSPERKRRMTRSF